jgi:hypothetical protein
MTVAHHDAGTNLGRLAVPWWACTAHPGVGVAVTDMIRGSFVEGI